jgi:hypothetical protein
VRGHSQIGRRAGNIGNEVQLRWGGVSSRAEASMHSSSNHHQLFGSLVDAAAALLVSGTALGRGPSQQCLALGHNYSLEQIPFSLYFPSRGRRAPPSITPARFGLEVALFAGNSSQSEYSSLHEFTSTLSPTSSGPHMIAVLISNDPQSAKSRPSRGGVRRGNHGRSGRCEV